MIHHTQFGAGSTTRKHSVSLLCFFSSAEDKEWPLEAVQLKTHALLSQHHNRARRPADSLPPAHSDLRTLSLGVYIWVVCECVSLSFWALNTTAWQVDVNFPVLCFYALLQPWHPARSWRGVMVMSHNKSKANCRLGQWEVTGRLN